MDKEYFDATAMLTAYQKDTGSIASQYLAAAIMELEPIINKAYRDGYADALLDSQKKQKKKV